MFSTMHNSKAIITNHILLALQKLGLTIKQKIAKPIQNIKKLAKFKTFQKNYCLHIFTSIWTDSHVIVSALLHSAPQLLM